MAGLQEDMACPRQRDLECLEILRPRMFAEKFKLPAAIARGFGGLRKLELCLDDERSLARWKVEVFPDVTDGGHLYLRQGWKPFTRALNLKDGFSLVLRYDGKSQINVKVFDITNCRKQYPLDFEAGGSQLSLPIAMPRSFAMILRKYHLKEKYLAKNMPVDFEIAHKYKQVCMVELQMAGQSWFMGLDRIMMNKVLRVALKYGWGEFCAHNKLDVSDTYFFSVIREATCSDAEDEDMEEKKKRLDEERKLKVEVHKTDGGWSR